MLRILSIFLAVASFLAAETPGAKPSFTVGWSVYAGWTPYHYLMQSGIMRKWADKYGITIKIQRFDYAPSLDAFVAKNIDACTMTNMEALDMPAASGVPTTAIIIGDYSNGNDALLVRNGLQMKDLPGKKMLLVQKTVSEYLLDRAMTHERDAGSDQAGAADQYFGFRHRDGVSERCERVGDGDVEADGVADRQAEGHYVAV